MQLITEEFHLLNDRFSTSNTPCRPPWAIAELPFIQACTHCGECIDACPERILVYGRGDYPEIDFSKGGCTFCGRCAQACESGGLRLSDKHPWHARAFIARTCLTNGGAQCSACGESCPVNAISFRQQIGDTSVAILEEIACNGCGACVTACPVSAIHVYRLV